MLNKSIKVLTSNSLFRLPKLSNLGRISFTKRRKPIKITSAEPIKEFPKKVKLELSKKNMKIERKKAKKAKKAKEAKKAKKAKKVERKSKYTKRNYKKNLTRKSGTELDERLKQLVINSKKSLSPLPGVSPVSSTKSSGSSARSSDSEISRRLKQLTIEKKLF